MPVLEVRMSERNDSREAFQRWKQRIATEFSDQPETAEAIVKSLLEECGGLRISLPDLQNIAREARDARICALYWKGSTYDELSVNFDLSIVQVRRIVNGRRDKK